MIVLDTSGLYALLSAKQEDHKDALRAIQSEPGPFLLSPFVLAELDYLVMTRRGVEAEIAMLREVARTYEVVPFNEDDVSAASDLVEQYQDLKIGLADASIAVIAGKMRTTRLLTLDERHFRAVRPLWGDAFTLLPKDQQANSS